MVGLEFDNVAGTVGDERVIGVVGEQGQLGVGRGLDPAPALETTSITPNAESGACSIERSREGNSEVGMS
jgi:hypothetical protein